MKIIVTFIVKDKKVDYQVNTDMPIRRALEIISQNDGVELPEHCEFFYSQRKQETLGINMSFKQANIHAGDIIMIHASGGKKDE